MKKQIIFFVLMAFGMMAFAQSRNPYEAAANNEDEVIHIEQWQRHAAVPLQAIVKLQDYSEYTIVAPKGAKSSATSPTRVSCPAIQAVLDSFFVESVEQLCPTFVMPREPRRSASYGGGEVVDHDLSQLYLITLKSESPKREYELIEALSALAEVEYAEPNYLVFALGKDNEECGMRNEELFAADATAYANSSFLTPHSSLKSGSATPNDPMYSLQWGLGACHIDSLLTAPKRDTTWRPIIAIIDTGVDVDHADLADNIWSNSAEQNGATGQDDDGNGFADDVHGWDFVNRTAEMHDFNSHGTHCAGIAGAVTNNGIGIAGACPDALIMPVCVMQSDGSGNIATIIQGINYARQNGADVISMSIGTYAYSSALEQALAVAYQSAVLVAAAGNDHEHIQPAKCGHRMCGPMFPGAFTFVLGVQASGTTLDITEGNGMLASFSNIDNDGGPASSSYSEEQLYNYELSAPGVGIMSTVPNGQYRNYNGTSMACPLVAGGIASLLQRRDYATKEILWGDLINHSQAFYPIDFWEVYNADSIAPAVLQCVTIEVNDTAFGDSSMYADAGERLQLYPTLRTVWGPTDSIEVWLEFQEFEDTNTVHILQNHVAFARPLSSYAHGKSVNPIDIQIDNNVVDGRRIQLTLCAYSTDATDTLRHNFTLPVTNGVKLHGMVTHNDTLWPNVQYIVTDNYAIVNGAELVIKPGVTLKIKDGVSISNAGKIYAVGTPDSMITFTKTELGNRWGKLILTNNDTISYSVIEFCTDIYANLSIYNTTIFTDYNAGTINNKRVEKLVRRIPVVSNSIVQNTVDDGSTMHMFNIDFRNTNYFNNTYLFDEDIKYPAFIGYSISELSSYYSFHVYNDTIPKSKNNNFINNRSNRYYAYKGLYIGFMIQDVLDSYPWSINVFNNFNLTNGGIFNMYTNSSELWSVAPKGLYLGTAEQSIAKRYIWDFDYPNSGTFGHINLQYLEQQPSSEAHGIVWKVEVNGYDAQDEFDSIIPLGVGTHEFKVYFNRAMDTNITPILAMGVRPPYTQTAISENASWSADSTIYTAYLTLTGRMPIDGLNRIYVNGAQDDEHFEIPYENQRFNVYVASSGSMSAGFQATPGIGKVDLEWNDQEVNYEDFLGFNIYRYQYDSVIIAAHYDDNWNWIEADTVWMPVDTIRINQSLVQDTTFTDFDVVPGERYYYYYKILSTSLTENSPSKTVSCVPHSTIPGDANGSYAVDVADVITTINYVTGQNPQPFLFDAADVNGDGVINVLDIVNIINIILHPGQQKGITDQQTAIYTIDNDTLYINTPVALAGLQFTLGCSRSDVEVLPALTPFECATVEEDGNLTMIFYSMSGMTVPEGKTALLRVENGDWGVENIALSDEQGQNVVAMDGNAVGLTDIETVQAQFATAYPNPFSGKTRIDITVGNYRTVEVVFTDLMGKQVYSREIVTPTAGRYSMTWDATRMPQGIYFATLYADGQKAQTIKLIVK